MLHSVFPATAPSRVVVFFLDEIAAGRLKPTAKIPSERELSDSLRVSRGTVRKALDELERKGLIKRRPGSGTFVTELAPEYVSAQGAAAAVPEISPAKLMEARIAIEPQMAALIVHNASNEDFDHMAYCLQKSEQADSIEQFEYWDEAFHKALAEATHNPFFAYLLKQINLIRAQSEWGVLKKKSLTAQARAQYQEQHQQILAALKKRDAKQAQQLLLEHLWLIDQHLFRPELGG